MSFHWFVLLAAVVVEVAATSALKAFVSAPLFAAILPLLLIGLSFALLSLALRVIPMAVAYAVWEGLGIVGIAVIGHILFAEHLTVSRILALALIIAGIVLLERGVGRDGAADGAREPDIPTARNPTEVTGGRLV
ncbi:SMR family transporter [Bosea sp. TWI1241]|uniref:SMR family transporter n=1 Tax=Bosea sp. TWI1241 TaxID=3148904 RepID=UPI00320BA811